MLQRLEKMTSVKKTGFLPGTLRKGAAPVKGSPVLFFEKRIH